MLSLHQHLTSLNHHEGIRRVPAQSVSFDQMVPWVNSFYMQAINQEIKVSTPVSQFPVPSSYGAGQNGTQKLVLQVFGKKPSGCAQVVMPKQSAPTFPNPRPEAGATSRPLDLTGPTRTHGRAATKNVHG